MPKYQYHHVGIPVDREFPAESYLPHLKIYASGFFESPYGVEWLKFDPDCQVPDLVRTVPHVAFVVDNMEEALAGQEVLIAPNRPHPRVQVAFIVHNGAPVELMQYDRPEDIDWPVECLYRPDR